MSNRLSKIKDESGQITVFLTLLFFLMLGIGFLVFGGMREYFKSSLTEEVFDLAGENVLAQYDSPLSDRYHIFLMDPREESYLEEDGVDSVKDSFAASGFFQGIDCQITLDSSKKALDDDGKEILRQIKEWEICQGVKSIPGVLSQIVEGTDKDKSLSRKLETCDTDTSQTEDTKEEKKDGEELSEEEKARQEKAKNTWKNLKQVLKDLLSSGILLYVVDDSSDISTLQLSSSGELPSKGTASSSLFSTDGLGNSLTALSDLKKMCQSGIHVDKSSTLLTSDAYLIPYILEYFSNYRNQDKELEHCLNYEAEYLVAGKKTDKENLKSVADQIFLLRFIVNYGYAVGDSSVKTEADTMATLLTGILGLPEASEAVSMLLIAALCYGESLLEVRALFAGEKVALVKSADNWNLSFADAAVKLGSRASIKEVKNGVTYEQYLAVLLIIRSGSRKVLYRMMDLMQCNVRLEETDFLLKNCIYSFNWTGTFSWNPFYRRIIAFGISQDQPYSMSISRTVCYN